MGLFAGLTGDVPVASVRMYMFRRKLLTAIQQVLRWAAHFSQFGIQRASLPGVEISISNLQTV